MLKYFRIILYTLTGFFLFIIVYVTFFSNQYRGLLNTAQYTEPGLYAVSGESGSFIKELLSASGGVQGVETDELFLDKQTAFNAYYVSDEGTDLYKRTIKGDTETIQIGEGEYYFDFVDPLKKYTIQADDFTLELLTKGKLYIKNSERRVGFYSFDGVFNIQFKDVYTDTFTNSFYIFPGMYAKGSKNRKQSGVDESLEATNELFYINNLQLSSKKKKQGSDTNVTMHSFSFIYNREPSFSTSGVSGELKKIIGITTDFLDDALLHSFQERQNFRDAHAYFEQLKTFETPLFAELEGYFSIFFNDSKKVVYFKNLILGDLAQLVEKINTTPRLQRVIDQGSQETMQEIFQNLELLREISQEDYEITKTFLNDFYFFYDHIYQSDYVTKSNIEKMYLQVNEREAKDISNDDFLSYLFSLYNEKEITEFELNKGLMKYIFSTSKVLSAEDEKSFYYYYYSYNKILKNYIRSIGVRKEGFQDILRIFQETSFINEGYFNSDQVKKGMLYINVEIIENIIQYLFELYFEEQRDENDLLVLKNNDINMSDTTILTLEENINYLFQYQKNAKLLDPTNENEGALLQKYLRLKRESEEYFEAIINNDEYRNAKTLDALKNIGERKDDEYVKPNKEAAKKYLSGFNQVDITGADIEVIDESYYEVKNLRIASDIMSFDLHPLEFNKITNIKKGSSAFSTLSDILLTNSETNFDISAYKELTQKIFYDYLLNLGNIEVYEESIQFQKGDFYEIKNINVGGTKYSFLFFPKNDNKVQEVMEGLGVTYKLDNLKPQKGSRNEVTETEKFKNFFVDLISKTREIERELVTDGDQKPKDSVAENIFKNDFLFGKNGDFTGIQNKLNLKFENVTAKLGANKSTSYIEKIEMATPESIPKTEKGETVRGEITSEYIISEFNSYFEKMEVQFYFTRGEGNIRYDFVKEKMQVLGKINIEDFDTFYDNLWSDYQKMSEVNSMKQKILGEANIAQLRYSGVSRDAIITYPHKGSTITITFQKGEILRIKYKSDIFEGAELKNLQNIFSLFL